MVLISTLIKFENVSKAFKEEKVLKNVSFELDKNKIYGFVGRNGSGKTMIFKLLTGLMRPSEGDIHVMGVNMTKSRKFPENTGALLETPGFIPHYTGLQNLKVLNSISQNRVATEEIKKCIKMVGLDPESKKQVKTYSLGMKQKLGIAQAIMNKPELLVLDEPMNGLDEGSVHEMRKFFQHLRNEKGTTILLASHNKEDIEILCDELFYVKEGVVSKASEVK